MSDSPLGPALAATREHEFLKYLQVVVTADADHQPHCVNENPFCFRLQESSSLRDALFTHMELLRLRLPTQGAFVVLTDGTTPYFLAGSSRSPSSENDEPCAQSASWLGNEDRDLQHWLWIFQQTISVHQPPGSYKEKIFNIPSLSDNEHSSKLSTVCNAPHLSFYAGTPIISQQGIAIGVVFVVDGRARTCLTEREGELLKTVAEKCKAHIESALEIEVQGRWKKMNQQLCRFIGSRAIRDQVLEEPTDLGNKHQQLRRRAKVDEMHNLALLHGHDPSELNITSPENDFSTSSESDRLLDIENKTRENIAKQEEEYKARNITAQAKNDSKRSDGRGETAYRKMFRRAAECLQDALQVDGVLFNNGLAGHHGIAQPVPESETDLEHEMTQRPHRESVPKENTGEDPIPAQGGIPRSYFPPNHQESIHKATTKSYESPEYRRGVDVTRYAEILGIYVRHRDLGPEQTNLTETSKGLTKLDEGYLQVLMDRYPEGNVWYIHDTTGSFFSMKHDSLVEDEPSKETQHLISSFPGVRQIIFQPLTDPVSLKRLAGCFAWSTRKLPVFTDTTDLLSLRGFLHILESEVSRIDTSAALKQKEAFVSSVSHELRTPLHGILGSVQLLADTDLDPFQTGLADTIRTSSSTLNETLTSVLSYARINQFERQQHKYRERQPPDANWSHSNKMKTPPGADTNFKGLYVSVNLALLIEELTGVLEAGQSYDKSAAQRSVTVINEVDYEENWNYFTEPGALRRISLNIIGNALKYTHKGSVTIKLNAFNIDVGDIETRGDRVQQQMTALTIKDTGKGMSKDFMDNHLFVPFTQEDTNSSNGVGLGMSIVKSLVSLLGGTIDVKSELGVGTEVKSSVPMTLCNPDQDDVGEPALEFKRRTDFVRAQNLSVMLFGFEGVVLQAVEKYLNEWFLCTLLASTDSTKPSVILVNESSEQAFSDVEKIAKCCGRSSILLSVASIAGAPAKQNRPIEGFTKTERLQRPIGPDSIGKALSACVARLRHLRERGDEGELDRTVLEVDMWSDADQLAQESTQLSYNSAVAASKGKSPSTATQSHPHTDYGGNTPLPEFEDSRHRHEDNLNDRALLSASESSVARPPSGDTGLGSRKYRILVVEDNAVNRRILGAFLSRKGYHNIQYAENGELAVKLVEETSEVFDLIFMDLSMPVMNGFAATREIRRIERERQPGQSSSAFEKSAYIVALTGLASDRDEDEALSAGVDDFLTKPLQFNKLLAILK